MPSRPSQEEKPFPQLEASLEKAGRIEELIRLYENRAREVPSCTEAAHLIAKAAALARRKLKDLPRAEALLRNALLLAPDERDHLRDLRLLYEQTQEHGALAEVLERMAALCLGPEGAALYLRAAVVHDDRLRRADRALRCCQLAARAHPTEREAYRTARRLLLRDGRTSMALDWLEREHAAAGGEGLADEYVRLALALTSDPSEHPNAERALEAALKLAPGHGGALAAKEVLASLPSNWAERVRALRAESQAERERKVAARKSLMVAWLLHAYEMGSEAKVQEAVDRALLLWPAMPEALSFLSRKAEAQGTVAELVERLEQMAVHAERGAKVDLWIRAGALRLERLSDPARAMADFEKAASLDPSRPDPVSLATELMLELGRSADAAALLERHLATVKDRAGRNELRWRLIVLYRDKVCDEGRERTCLEAILRDEPTHPGAAFEAVRLSVASRNLEGVASRLQAASRAAVSQDEIRRLFGRVAQLASTGNDHALASQALAEAMMLNPSGLEGLPEAIEHARAGGGEALLAASLRRAAFAAPEPAAGCLWRETARLLRGLGRAEEAASAWREVQRRAPDDPEAHEALSAPAGPKPPPGNVQADLEAELLRLSGPFADPTALSQVCRRILELDPQHQQALRKLGGACAALRRWEEVAEVARRLSEVSESLEERAEWTARLAQLYAGRLGRQGEAAQLLLELLGQGHDSAVVVRSLERLASSGVMREEVSRALVPLYAKKGDHQRAAATLLLQLSSAKEAAEQKALLAQLAEVHEQRLADGRAALSLYLRAVSLDPKDESPRRNVARLARELSAHSDAAKSLAKIAARVEDMSLARSLVAQAAALAEEGGAAEAAERALLAGLSMDPMDRELHLRLVRLYAGTGRLTEAERLLKKAIHSAPAEERASLELELSELYAQLSSPRAAADALEHAIESGAEESEHLGRLCELYESSGQHAKLARALERAAAVAEAKGDLERASAARLRRAQVLQSTLGDRAAAVRTYAEVLEKRPRDPEALFGLENLLSDPAAREEAARALAASHRAAADQAGLLLALEALAQFAQDAQERIACLKEAAAVHLALGQPDLALAAFAGAVRAAPDDGALLAAALEAADRAGLLDTYAEVLEELLDEVPQPARSPLHRQLALLAEQSGDDVSAVRHLRAALELEPQHLYVLESLARLHRAAGEWASLAEVMERIAACLPDSEAQLSAWREAAALHEERLWDKEAALGCWRQLAERNPFDRDAAGAIDRLATTLARPHDLAFALELERAQEGKGPAWRDLTVRLARLRREALGDPAGAVELCRDVLALEPAHAPAQEALERWVEDPGEGGAAAFSALDGVLARQAEHERRVELGELRLAAADGEERARIATELMRVCEQELQQDERALLLGLKAFAAGGDRAALAPVLERLAAEADALEELAEVLETACDELMPGDEQAAPLLRRAAWIRERLDQPEDAIRLWSGLLSESAGDPEALDHLAKLYQRAGRQAELAAILQRIAAAAGSPAEKAAHLFRAAAAHLGAGEPEAALQEAKAGLEVEPESKEGLALLDRLFERAERASEQAEVLEKIAELSSGEERRDALARRGHALERDGRGSEALACYSAALEAGPATQEIRAGLARLLERDDARAGAAKLLERILREAGEPRGLAEILELRLEEAEGAEHRALLLEVAALRESLGEDALAMVARLKAFQADPEDEQAREQFRRSAEATGAFEELAGAYEDALERGVSAPAAVLLTRELAQLYGDRLGRTDLAVRAWEEVARRDPQGVEPARALADSLRRGGDRKKLAQALVRLAQLERTADAQANCYFEAAELFAEELSEPELAVQCYREVLARTPSDRAALKSLEKVLAEAGRTSELAEALERQLALSRQAGAIDEELELSARLARLKLSKLSDPRGALTLVESVLGRRSGHGPAMEVLEELSKDEQVRERAMRLLEPMLEGRGGRAKLVELLESQTLATAEPSGRAALLRRVARLRGDLGDPELAFLAAARALREDPADESSLALCASLAGEASAKDELCSLLSELAEETPSGPPRLAVCRALARAQREAGDLEAATAAWEEVSELAPLDAEADAELTKLYEEQERTGELVVLLSRRRRAAVEPAEKRALSLRIASALEAMGRPAEAVEPLREAFTLGAGASALSALSRVLQKLGRFEEQAEVLSRLASAAEDAEEEQSLALQKAEALAMAARHEQAVSAYAQVLASDPGNSQAVAGLEKLSGISEVKAQAARLLESAYQSRGEGKKRAQALELRLEAAAPGEALPLLRELAELRESLGELELAFALRSRLFAANSSDEGARAELERVGAAAGRLEELAACYEDHLDRAPEGPLALELWRTIASLRERLGQPAPAREAWEEVARLDPSSGPLRALADIYRRASNHEHLARVLLRQSEVEPEREAQLDALFEAAQLAEETLGDRRLAAEAYRRILERQPKERSALRSLREVLEASGEHRELASVLEREIALAGEAGSPEEVLELRLELGRLKSSKLGEREGAVAELRKVLDASAGEGAPKLEGALGGAIAALEELAASEGGSRAEAASLVEPLLERAGAHARLASVLEAHAYAEPTPKGRAALWLRAAQVTGWSLGDDVAAFLHAARALRECPEDERPLELCLDLSARAEALEELCALLEEVAPRAAGHARARLYRALARAQDRAEEAEGPLRSWREVLAELPSDVEALRRVEEILAEARQHQELSKLLRTRLAAVEEVGQRLSLLTRIAEAEEASGDRASAIDTLRSAFALSRSDSALRSLDRLLGLERRYPEQAEVLERLAELSEDPGERKEQLLRRGEALAKGGAHEAAAEAFADVLAVAAAEPRAVEGLEALLASGAARRAAALLEVVYRGRGDDRKLVEVLDLQLPASPPEARGRMLREITRLREAQGDTARAFSASLAAFAELPQDEGGRAEMERLAEATGSYGELADQYRALLEREPDGPLAPGLWRRLAQLYEGELGRPDLAAQALEEVLRRASGDRDALSALARLARQASDWRRLASLLERLAKVEPSEDERISFLLELAVLCDERLSDKAASARYCRAVLELRPGHPDAAELLSTQLFESGQFDELAALLERRISLAPGGGGTELRTRLARLEARQRARPERAIALAEEVLRQKPAEPGAMRVLEEVMRSQAAGRAWAGSILEPIYAQAQRHDALVEALEAQLSEEPEPAARVALLERIGELHAGPLLSPLAAYQAAARALKELPDREESLAGCVSLAAAAGKRAELAGLLEELASPPGGAARPGLRACRARLLEELGRAAEAIDSWQTVLAFKPADPEALERVSALLERESRWGELLEVLRRRAELAEGDEEAGLLLRAAALQQDRLGDGEGALATLRRLLELRPRDGAALERMDRLCQSQERWPELESVLRARLEGCPPPARGELQLRLADLLELRLAKRDAAVEQYSQLLAKEPGHEKARARLEEILAAGPHQAAAAALLDAFRKTKSLDKLAVALDREAARAEPGRRRGTLCELARVREAQQEPELAFLAQVRAFREDPAEASLRGELERLADAASAHDALAEAYAEALPGLPDEVAAKLCLRIGALYESELSDSSEAIDYYQRARGLAAASDEVAIPALARLFEATGRWEELAAALEATLARAPEPERVATLLRLAHLAEERLESPERAAAFHERALEADPRCLEAGKALSRLYGASSDPRKLYSALDRLRQLLFGAEREDAVLEMARVAAGPLADLDLAISLCRQALADNVRSEEAFAGLSRLLEQAGRSSELKDLLEARLRRTLEPKELVRLHQELGRVQWRLLGHPAEAVPHFRAALDREPRNEAILRALVELYESLARPGELAEVLRRLVLLLSGEAAEVKESRKAARIRLAELCIDAGRRDEALDAAKKALADGPHTAPELDRLRRSFLALQAFLEAAAALELRAQSELARGDAADAVATLFEVAELQQRGKSPQKAAPALERILELEPARREAYDQLVQLYSRAGEWAAYARAVERFLPHFEERERLAALRELAEIHAGRLGDAAAAFQALRSALPLSPEDDGLAAKLEELAKKAGKASELASALEETADGLPRGEVAARLYLRLSAVADERLDDADRAVAALERLLEFDPVSATALERLAAVHARGGRHREQVAALERRREVVATGAERKAILRQVSAIWEEKLMEPAEAASALLRAIELEPDEASVRALVELERRHQRWAEAAQALLLLQDVFHSPEGRAGVQVEIAELWERDAADPEAAVRSFRMALELDPRNAAALASLERLYGRLDRPAELLGVLERRLGLSPSPKERVELLFQCAFLWEDRLGNPLKADASVEAVLSIEPKNLQAIQALERLRREQGRFRELVAAQERHLQAITDREVQAELWVDMGDVLRQELRDLDRAEAAYRRALELNSRSAAAMRALFMLHERRADWPRAIEMLQREAALHGQSPEAADLNARAGKIYASMLFDTGRARQAFLSARKASPGHLGAIRALRAIAEQERDWASFERTLADEAEHAPDIEQKIQALLELARHHGSRKGEPEPARKHYRRVLELAPHSAEAAAALSELAFAAGDWAEAARGLEVVTAQKPQGPQGRAELARQLQRLGQARAHLGEREGALLALRRAVEVDEDCLPAKEELASMLLEAGRSEEALEAYETLLSKTRPEATDMGRVALLCRVGELWASVGQSEKARERFEKALSIAPSHQHALRGLAHLHEVAGRHRQAAELKQRLSLVLEGEPRFQVCLELGRLAREKLSDSLLAIDAYTRALKSRPDSLEALEPLQAAYRDARQLSKAAKTLETIAAHPEVSKNPERRVRALLSLGEVCGVELGEVDRALAAYGAALDADSGCTEAFAAIESLLRSHRRWAQLEDAYLKMLGRLGSSKGAGQRRASLLRALGDLRAGELARPEQALEAYEAAAKEGGEDAELLEKAGRLAARLPGREEVAIASLRRSLMGAREPAPLAAALAALFAKRKEYDSAYLAAKVTEGFSSELGPGEREILAKLGPFAKKREHAKSALSERLWREKLLHPMARALAELMEVLFEQAGGQHAASHSDYGVHPKKHRVDAAAGGHLPVLELLRYARRVLGVERLEVYSPYLAAKSEPAGRRPAQPPDAAVGVELCQTDPPCLKLGGRLFTSDAKEVLCLLAFAVAWARPELALVRRTSREELAAMLHAAVSLVTERFESKADPREVKRQRKQLERALSDKARESLATVARSYAAKARPDDLEAYLAGAELTALRAALLVSGEPLAVRRALIEGRGVLSQVSQRQAARELMSFAVGGELQSLRAALGTAVEVSFSG
ncbi:MAG: tetratricopeptide repeat protein [Myxococcales bacterium]|nr:tetratricopeptide repeat protein [Myxococcales bacterium]